VLKPVVARYQSKGARISFCGDAAFATPSVYEYLESHGIDYAIRLPANQILQGRVLPGGTSARLTRGSPRSLAA